MCHSISSFWVPLVSFLHPKCLHPKCLHIGERATIHYYKMYLKTVSQEVLLSSTILKFLIFLLVLLCLCLTFSSCGNNSEYSDGWLRQKCFLKLPRPWVTVWIHNLQYIRVPLIKLPVVSFLHPKCLHPKFLHPKCLHIGERATIHYYKTYLKTKCLRKYYCLLPFWNIKCACLK